MPGKPSKVGALLMEGGQERVEPLDRAYDLSSLSSEVEAVARGDRSMQQCLMLGLVRPHRRRRPDRRAALPVAAGPAPHRRRGALLHLDDPRQAEVGPTVLDQIAKARSSNATVNRWPAATSTASS